jgi:hypothetical protein
MNGRDILLILAHLFRMKGNPVGIGDAVEFLSFRCRYGKPSDIRRMFTLALENDMVAAEGNVLMSKFLYEEQNLPPNLATKLGGTVSVRKDVKQLA